MKKAIKIIFFVVCFVLLVGLIGGYVFLSRIDFNQYRDKIVKIVYEQTGRELGIGNIDLKASLNPTLKVSDVTFSNADWSKNPQMFQAKEIDLGIAVLPLLKKKIEIATFSVNQAVIYLEDDVKNGVNWEFKPSKESEEKITKNSFELIRSANAEEIVVRNNTGELLSALVIKTVLLDDVIVSFTSKDGKTQKYDIKEIRLDENNDKDIDFSFDVNKGEYQGKGTLGALSLLENKNGYPVLGNFDIMGIKAHIDAKIFDMFNNLAFETNAEVSQFLGKNSGYNESLITHIKGDMKKINIDIEKLSIAENVILGKILADLASDKPNITVDLSSNKIDIAPFMKTDKVAWRVLGIKEAYASELVPNLPLPYDILSLINAEANVKIDTLSNKNKILAENGKIFANLKNGQGNIKITMSNFAKGKVDIATDILAKNKSVKINGSLSKVNINQLLSALDATPSVLSIKSGGDVDIYLDLVGFGKTYNDVVNSLDGKVAVILGQSDMYLGNIGILKGNIISQLLNTLQIVKDNDDLNLKCAVIRADLKKGVALFPNGIAINADKFTVVADGNINLNNDKISLSIKPFAGKLTDTNIAKALSSLVKLSGTLSHPKLGIDGANAIKNFVGMTTTGPVYLGAQMLMENDGSPCYTALVGTGYENRFPKSQNVAKDVGESVETILDGGVDAVKNTTKEIFNILTGGK